MLAFRPLGPKGHLLRALSSNSQLPSVTFRGVHSTAPVDLAYDHIPPPSGSTLATHSDAAGPLVICHGLFGSKQNWRSLCKAFARSLDRPVYALDLRNHGTSPHNEIMNYQTMADDIKEFCHQKSLSKISLLGHSMGGKVVMAFALDPDLPADMLSRLIVADISPAKGPISTEFQTYVKAMKEIEAKGTKNRKEADEVLQAYEPDVSTRQFLLTNLQPATATTPQKFRIPLDTLERAIDGIGDFPYEPEHRQWGGKTLFIKGAQSKYINKRNIPIARQYFPDMRLEVLEAGHWVHAERPTEFVKLVTEFIDS